MIVAVGLDLVEVARVRRAAEGHPQRFLSRCFHPDELEALHGRSDPYPGLAARFAAKEAFAKVWREPLGWRDVWVVKEGRRPVLRASERVSAVMEREGLVAHLSLSHTAEHASAVVVLERREGARA